MDSGSVVQWLSVGLFPCCAVEGSENKTPARICILKNTDLGLIFSCFFFFFSFSFWKLKNRICSKEKKKRIKMNRNAKLIPRPHLSHLKQSLFFFHSFPPPFFSLSFFFFEFLFLLMKTYSSERKQL